MAEGDYSKTINSRTDVAWWSPVEIFYSSSVTPNLTWRSMARAAAGSRPRMAAAVPLGWWLAARAGPEPGHRRQPFDWPGSGRD